MNQGNPIIFLGGFLVTSEAYFGLMETIEKQYNRKIYIVDVTKIDWIKTNSKAGWKKILDKVAQYVSLALDENKAKKVDLIGHSSGGLILRLFLASDPFNGTVYDGSLFTKNLITLGSPHQAKRATRMRKFVNDSYPANYFDDVNYISVGGKVEIFSNKTSFVTKIVANSSYKSISGNKSCDGDGLVPLSSSLLEGSQKIVVKNVVHGGIFGKEWYGTPLVVKTWWEKIIWQ